MKIHDAIEKLYKLSQFKVLAKPDPQRVDQLLAIVWSNDYTPMKRTPLWDKTGNGTGWGRDITFTTLEIMGHIVVDEDGFVHPNR
jgi:hypothetical protein